MSCSESVPGFGKRDHNEMFPPPGKHHPDIASVLRFFAFAHLPARLQEVSRPFGELAEQVADRAPASPETTVALRKLLEAKDAAVRATL